MFLSHDAQLHPPSFFLASIVSSPFFNASIIFDKVVIYWRNELCDFFSCSYVAISFAFLYSSKRVYTVSSRVYIWKASAFISIEFPTSSKRTFRSIFTFSRESICNSNAFQIFPISSQSFWLWSSFFMLSNYSSSSWTRKFSMSLSFFWFF